MKGITPLSETGFDRERWRTLSEAMSDVYMDGWLAPGAGALDGVGMRDDASQNFPFTSFPNGVTGRLRYNLWTRPRWHGCGIRLKVWYTSDPGSTATFNLSIGARQTRAGANLSVPLALFTQNLTPAGPAVAQDVGVFEYVSAPGLVSSHYDILSFRFVRDGAADSNANEYWQVLAYYEFLETP
jgi:hypothetical protein